MAEQRKVGSVTYRDAGQEYFDKRGLRRHAGVWSLWALGVAGSALGPPLLWASSESRPAVGIAAGLVGLGVFATLTLIGQWAASGAGAGTGDGWPSLVLAFPVVVAAPAGALVLWLARRAGTS